MLIIFDIDGTLTRSDDLHTECWVRAAGEVFGSRDICTDWATYRHVTDGGILAEIFEQRHGQGASPAETEAFSRRLIELQAEYEVEEIPGAREFVRLLHARGDTLAIATGCWRAVALERLRRSGFDLELFLTIACAEDGMSREEIIEAALRRAGATPMTARDAVYIGDGIWDARATRNLRMKFIGIAADAEQSARLREAGAAEVFRDYSDPKPILHALSADSGSHLQHAVARK